MRNLLVVCLLVSASVACNANKEKAGSETKAAEQGETGGTDAKGECAQYAEQLCEKVGDKSKTCSSVKETLELLPPAACKAGQKDLEYTASIVEERRKECDQLMTKLCKDLGEDTGTCKMVREQTPNFPPERCSMMMKQYDEVLADLQRREEANKPLDETKQAKMVEGAQATFGPEDAKVQIVEFSDFQCPFCSRSATAVSEIKKKYEDKVHFVFRQFPLSFHKQAHLAAQAALAAAEQGKFWEYHDKLFENQKQLQREDLEKYAEELGLNMAKFKKALDEGTYKDEVEADLALGKVVAVSGTPTMFINGERVSNPTDASVISKEIEEALKAN